MEKIAIFDMDGTVLDSMDAWRSLNVLYAEKLGVPLTDEARSEIYQLSGTQFVRYFQSHFGLEMDIEQIINHAYDAMRVTYTRGVPEKPGAKAYLKRLGERGVKRVIATATPTDLAEIALKTSSLAPYVDLLTTTRMIGIEKYKPEFWLEVASRAGGTAAECTVYEDALYAIEGARKAGMKVIGMEDPTNLCDREAMRSLCEKVIASYDELALD